MESENYNLNLFEIAQVMAMFGKKVLAPKELLKAGANVKKGIATTLGQAGIVAALNVPMGHIYVKAATRWGDESDEVNKLDIVKTIIDKQY